MAMDDITISSSARKTSDGNLEVLFAVENHSETDSKHFSASTSEWNRIVLTDTSIDETYGENLLHQMAQSRVELPPKNSFLISRTYMSLENAKQRDNELDFEHFDVDLEEYNSYLPMDKTDSVIAKLELYKNNETCKVSHLTFVPKSVSYIQRKTAINQLLTYSIAEAKPY